jgi:hypothetical protein
MKPVTEYGSVEMWKVDVEAAGYVAGTQVCRGLAHTMATHHLTFPQAYNYLMESGMLTLVGKHFIIDSKATQP